MLEALATRLFEVLSDAIDAVPRTEDVAGDLVEAGVRAFRQTALDHPSLYRLVFVQVVPDLELGSEFGAVATAAFARLEQLIARIGEASARRPLGRRRRRRVPLLDEGSPPSSYGEMLNPQARGRVAAPLASIIRRLGSRMARQADLHSVGAAAPLERPATPPSTDRKRSAIVRRSP